MTTMLLRRAVGLASCSALPLLAPLAAAAQAGVIEGYVVHAETGAPVAGASVTLREAARRAIASDSGFFRIVDVPSGAQTVVVSHLGYGSETRPIQVGVGQTVRLEVELAEQAIQLGGIRVIGRRGGLVASEPASITKTGAPLVETAQSVSVITSGQLALQDIGTIAEATRYTPGIRAEPWGFEPRLTFLQVRGFDATTTGLYRDGLQLRNPGYAVGYNLEPYGAERIEVLRGPASVLYGAANPGGLVNYVTKRPTTVPLGEVEIESGTYERMQGKLDVGGPIRDAGSLGYRITGLYRNSGTQVEFIENDRLFIAPTFTWRPTGSTGITLLSHYKQDESKASQALPAAGLLTPNPHGEIPVSRFTGEPDVDRYDRTDWTLGWIAEHSFTPTLSARQNLRWYDIELDDVTIFTMGLQANGRTIDRALYESFGDASGLGIDNQVELALTTGALRHQLMAGLDYSTVSAASVQTYGAAPSLDIINPVYGQPVPKAPTFLDQVTEQRQLGLYLSDRIEIGDALFLTAAARHDRATTEIRNHLSDETTSQDDDAFTFQAGVLYRTPFGLAPYLSYSESFLPALGADAGGKAFDPERGRQYEVGVKYEPHGWNGLFTVALFDLKREDFIQYDPETFLQVQTGEVVSRGVELEAVAGLATGLDVIGSLTWLAVEITRSSTPAEVAQRPAQTPDGWASLWLDYTIPPGPLGGLGLGAGVRHVGRSYGDVGNTVEVPAVTLADATLSYDVRDIQVSVNVQNVFGRKYVAAAFWRSSLLATYGPARTVTAGLRWRW